MGSAAQVRSARRRFGRHGRTLAAAVAVASLFTPPAAHAKGLGLNVHQSSGVGLDVTRDAGLGWVRIDLNWLDAQPTNAPPDFALFDGIVDGAKARGLEVLAVVGYGPAWASSGDAKGDGSNNDVPLPGTYAAFVSAVVDHFKDRVTHYELWNEPNLEGFFEGTPADYVDTVLVPGADAVHASCPSCKVVAPGLATVGDQYAIWLDAALAAAKDRIDVVSGHIYAGFSDAKTSDNFWNKLESHRIIDVGGSIVFEGPLSFREVMDAHGATAPFWLTESGLEATLGDAAEEEAQLVYYRHVLELMLGRPWWETTIFYEAFDEPPAPYEWGVAVHAASAPGGYSPKAVMGLLGKATQHQAAFGGDGVECADGLDDEGDGLVDYPDDPDCTSVLGKSEGQPPVDAGAGGNGGAAGSAGAPATSGAAPSDDGGCGCRAAASGDVGALRGLAALALAALAGSTRRRRGVMRR